jgi:elongation factor P
MIGANELKRKMIISVDGDPYVVLEVFFASPSARGASTMVRTKLRHLLTGAASERSFKTAEQFDEADVDTVSASFLYRDDQGYCFMEEETFEQHYLGADQLGESCPYLKEGLVLKIMKYNGAVASVQLPVYVNLQVVETEGATRRDSGSGGGNKTAKLETGLTVRVPIYIESGDIVRVNTETGEVAGRAT